VDRVKARAATARAVSRPRTRRYATVAEIERLNRQLADLRRNPLVRLGSILDWEHIRRGVVNLIRVGGSLAEIVRLFIGR
jgi:hypothetical protein